MHISRAISTALCLSTLFFGHAISQKHGQSSSSGVQSSNTVSNSLEDPALSMKILSPSPLHISSKSKGVPNSQVKTTAKLVRRQTGRPGRRPAVPQIPADCRITEDELSDILEDSEGLATDLEAVHIGLTASTEHLRQAQDDLRQAQRNLREWRNSLYAGELEGSLIRSRIAIFREQVRDNNAIVEQYEHLILENERSQRNTRNRLRGIIDNIDRRRISSRDLAAAGYAPRSLIASTQAAIARLFMF